MNLKKTINLNAVELFIFVGIKLKNEKTKEVDFSNDILNNIKEYLYRQDAVFEYESNKSKVRLTVKKDSVDGLKKYLKKNGFNFNEKTNEHYDYDTNATEGKLNG